MMFGQCRWIELCADFGEIDGTTSLEPFKVGLAFF